MWVRERETHVVFRDHKGLAQVDAETPVDNVADDVCPKTVQDFSLPSFVGGHDGRNSIEFKVYRQSTEEEEEADRDEHAVVVVASRKSGVLHRRRRKKKKTHRKAMPL